MKEIITDSQILQKPAKVLEFLTDAGMDITEGQQIISELKEVMEANHDIIALTAPQIGIDKRIFAIRFNDGIKVFINPIITKKEKYNIGIETNISFPDKEFMISRPTEVSAVYYTEQTDATKINSFKYEDNKFLSPAAEIFDQSIQFLDGITPDELGLVSTVSTDGSWKDASEEDFKAGVEIYKQFIKLKQAQAEEVIKQDDALSRQYNKLRFTESVINGKTTVIDLDTPHVPNMNREQRRAMAKQLKRAKSKNKFKNAN